MCRQQIRKVGAEGLWECIHAMPTTSNALPVTACSPASEETAVECLATSVDCYRYRHLRVTVLRVTDNGPCYTSRAIVAACKRFGIMHVQTKAYTPEGQWRRRGSSRRLREWAYARRPTKSRQTNALRTFRRGCTYKTGTGRAPLGLETAYQLVADGPR